MKKLVSAVIFLFSAAVGFSQFPNITISIADYPNEPTIAVSHVSPGIIAAGANNDKYYYSSDFGWSWTQDTLTSPYGVAGDPCLVTDTSGNFYYLHLSYPHQGSWLDRIVCQKSTDHGHTWNDGSYMGLNGSKQQDKPWSAVDPVTNCIYTCWTQFDLYGSTSPNDSSIILFSRSADNGLSWGIPLRINKIAGDCRDSDNTVEGAVPAPGPNGEVYVSWAGPAGLVFTKSMDQGLTWPANNISVTDIPGGWDFNIPGIFRCNGMPVTCCDLSNGPYHGTIYINWTDQRNGQYDTDVFLVKSTDGGISWTTPQRVNDDPPGKHQFFSWMTIDQATGYLYIIFYDRRNYSDLRTDVYMAVSHDGGNSFQNMKVSESPFLPDASVFFGDYTNISAWNNMVRPIWCRLDGSNLSIVTAIVDSANLLRTPEKDPVLPISLRQNYPNPATNFTNISFKLNRPATVSLVVFDLFGSPVSILIELKSLPAGEFEERFDLSKALLQPGLYFYRLVTDENAVSLKMIVN